MSLLICMTEITDHNAAEQLLLDRAFPDSPEKPVLSHLASGHPFLACRPDTSISISHSGSWCIIRS